MGGGFQNHQYRTHRQASHQQPKDGRLIDLFHHAVPPGRQGRRRGKVL